MILYAIITESFRMRKFKISCCDVQKLGGESPLLSSLSSLPLCSLLYTNFSFNEHINLLLLTVFFVVLYFFGSQRKFQSLPGCFLWPVWYQFSIPLKFYLVRVIRCSQSVRSSFSFTTFSVTFLLCFRTI